MSTEIRDSVNGDIKIACGVLKYHDVQFDRSQLYLIPSSRSCSGVFKETCAYV